MNLRERILVTVAAFLLTFSSSAQFGSNPTIVNEPCATMVQDSISRAKYPERGTLLDFERILQKKIHELELAQKSGRTTAEVVNIPIIVHVVHNGEAVGVGANISQAQVQAQIEVLNEDFRKLAGTPGGSSNNPIAADIEIEFCLSPFDESGNPMTEPGIHRYNGNRPDWTREQIENLLKPTTIWNPNLFYNIWTVRFASSDANILGYAQFPDQSGLPGLPASGPASTDGVVVRFQSFGSVDKGNFPVMQAPYNRGRTLTHETGHWLGLRHIWGDGGCSADDFVTDTPPADGPSSGCPVGRVSCSVVNMVENYMDYSFDACMNIFTQGQKTRMQAVIQVSPRRKSLIEGNLCSPVVADVPTANFTVSNQLVLLGGEVTFTDLSTNFPTSWSWIFEGGDPNTSTQRNPKIKYNNAGTYKVTLVATNSLGSSNPLEIEDFITVSEEGLCNSFNNFVEGNTASIIKLSAVGPYTGYLTGHNSFKSKGISEYFSNELGYQYISGVNVRFGKVHLINDEAIVNIVVWNARGPQSAPGSVIERKPVLLKQIKDDVDNNKSTTIYFDRETPVFGRPYQVGLELSYAGDTLAIYSSGLDESNQATSWIQDENGVWNPYAITFGANIAMDIETFVGMKTSVQVSASKLLVNPGEQVILNGKGASIFVWNSDDGAVDDYTGPQLIASPLQTTTYTTSGSGLELCDNTAITTIYVRENVVGMENPFDATKISIYPNPGSNVLNISIDNFYYGEVSVAIRSVVGNEILRSSSFKKENAYYTSIETKTLSPGVYLVSIRQGEQLITKKWAKY